MKVESIVNLTQTYLRIPRMHACANEVQNGGGVRRAEASARTRVDGRRCKKQFGTCLATMHRRSDLGAAGANSRNAAMLATNSIHKASAQEASPLPRGLRCVVLPRETELSRVNGFKPTGE